MDFRTEITPSRGQEGIITHHQPVVLVGSCFTDNIGGCLADELFDVTVNPFGPIYNPASINTALEIIASRRHVREEDLFEHEGAVHSFMFHSRFSAPTGAEAMLKMNSSIEASHEALAKASTLIVTLGTTRTYRHIDMDKVVANCHKQPASAFEECSLSLDDCTDALCSITDIARSLNPGIHIIFTVSPLRYLNYGAHGNTIAKATLQLAIERTRGLRDGIMYFPAFEIMMDDLRDYRFYAEDMKHPTQQAVRYIYDIFSNTYFNSQTRDIAALGRRITRRLSHRQSSSSTTDPDSAVKTLAESLKMENPFLAANIDKYITNDLHRK